MSSDSLDVPAPADLPVVVIGAGLFGLAAAAQLHEHEVPFPILEVGTAVAALVRAWADREI